eukprot:TRINITY_DN2389_c0_g1_i1.p1 TRINITY_DN2389_c0_g1~~TRINITY_DN2389_c0_g1_i1.p1  ORF type:complete len:360 (+),score=109.73 TRINITY_DN2389_c0_g1_i1:38-1117(+)
MNGRSTNSWNQKSKKKNVNISNVKTPKSKTSNQTNRMRNNQPRRSMSKSDELKVETLRKADDFSEFISNLEPLRALDDGEISERITKSRQILSSFEDNLLSQKKFTEEFSKFVDNQSHLTRLDHSLKELTVMLNSCESSETLTDFSSILAKLEMFLRYSLERKNINNQIDDSSVASVLEQTYEETIKNLELQLNQKDKVIVDLQTKSRGITQAQHESLKNMIVQMRNIQNRASETESLLQEKNDKIAQLKARISELENNEGVLNVNSHDQDDIRTPILSKEPPKQLDQRKYIDITVEDNHDEEEDDGYVYKVSSFEEDDEEEVEVEENFNNQEQNEEDLKEETESEPELDETLDSDMEF